MSNTEPTWIREGGTAAVDAGGVSFAVIERLTKTQIVLTNGHKYQRSGFLKAVPSTGASGHLADPANPNVIARYARQQLHLVAYEAGRTVNGSGATMYQMDAAAVREELGRIQDVLMAARKEIDRRAGL